MAKTQKQIETVNFAQQYFTEQCSNLDNLASVLKRIMEGYESLTGAGNTHGDNLEIRAYGEMVAEQIKTILYSKMMSAEARDTWRKHLYETYFKDITKGFTGLLSGIV